jgi:fructokinase
MAEITAIGLGELLWDMLPGGRQLGGAPANFAYHMNSLGGVGIPVSRVGDDALGRDAVAELTGRGLSCDHVGLDPAHPTGTVGAVLDAEGVATYHFPDDVAWDFLSFGPATVALADSVQAVCFGSLAQRSPVSRRSVRALLRAAPHALRIFDVNLRQHFHDQDVIRASLRLAHVLKINDDELREVSRLFCLPDGERAALETLIRRHDLRLAVLTRGGRGSLIVSPDGVSDLPGRAVAVVDTIGAGDAFTAAMTLAYLDGASLDEINAYASAVAAFVCSRAGAMPSMDPALRVDAR